MHSEVNYFRNIIAKYSWFVHRFIDFVLLLIEGEIKFNKQTYTFYFEKKNKKLKYSASYMIVR